jgi:hypothetical protein
MIDVIAARRHLAEKLPAGETLEITNEDVLDAAAAIVAGAKAGPS